MTLRSPTAHPAQRGNVLLLPLLALVLFGAICYALIIPAGEVSMDQEKDLTSAAQVTQYPAMLRTTVRRMMAQGLNAQELDFNESSTQTNGVFSQQGGGAARARSSDMVGSKSRWRFKTAPAGENGGNTGWFIAGVGEDGTSNKDIFAFLDDLSLPVCTQILRALGLPETPLVEATRIDFNGTYEGTPKQTGGAAATDTARTAESKYVFGAWAAEKKPQPYACVRNGKDGNYIYYHILVDR